MQSLDTISVWKTIKQLNSGTTLQRTVPELKDGGKLQNRWKKNSRCWLRNSSQTLMLAIHGLTTVSRSPTWNQHRPESNAAIVGAWSWWIPGNRFQRSTCPTQKSDSKTGPTVFLSKPFLKNPETRKDHRPKVASKARLFTGESIQTNNDGSKLVFFATISSCRFLGRLLNGRSVRFNWQYAEAIFWTRITSRKKVNDCECGDGGFAQLPISLRQRTLDEFLSKNLSHDWIRGNATDQSVIPLWSSKGTISIISEIWIIP